jgi:hypothetical protein
VTKVGIVPQKAAAVQIGELGFLLLKYSQGCGTCFFFRVTDIQHLFKPL